MNLHQALLEHERAEFGRTPLDLQGRPFLKTSLVEFNRFLCHHRDHTIGDLQESRWPIDDLNEELLIDFSRYLYENQRLKPSSLRRCLGALRYFIESTWAHLVQADEARVAELSAALESHLRRCIRLRKLSRQLREMTQGTSVPPTTPYEGQAEQLRMFNTEAPILEETWTDIWTVRDKRSGKITFEGHFHEHQVSLQAPKAALFNLRRGDRISLTLGRCWDATHHIVQSEDPLFA